MYLTKKSVLGILIAIFLITLSLSIPAHASDAVAVNDGDHVVQTIGGELFVGQGISINGSWITLFNVRYPEGGDIVTFPAERVAMVYHKGKPNPQKPAQ